jgi:uncharacterized membrane protein YoaK (UPF0700 family)
MIPDSEYCSTRRRERRDDWSQGCVRLGYVATAVFGPFAYSDSPTALPAGFAGVAAMAVQKAVERLHLTNLSATTIMTGNTTQATLDGIVLFLGADRGQRPIISTRF